MNVLIVILYCTGWNERIGQKRSGNLVKRGVRTKNFLPSLTWNDVSVDWDCGQLRLETKTTQTRRQTILHVLCVHFTWILSSNSGFNELSNFFTFSTLSNHVVLQEKYYSWVKQLKKIEKRFDFWFNLYIMSRES